MSRLLALAFVFVAAVAGCPAPTPSANDNTNSNGSVNQNSQGSRPLLTPGTYTGDVTVEVALTRDGVPVDEEQFQLRISETINNDGFPTATDGSALAVGDIVALVDAPPDLVTAEITAVQELGGELSLSLEISGTQGGVAVSGTGNVVYTPLSTSELSYALDFFYEGQNSSTNEVLRQTEHRAGRLVR